MLSLQSLKEEWRISFFVTAAVELFGGIVFVIFSTSKVQPWAKSNCNQYTHDDQSVKVVKWRNIESIG